MEEWISQCAVDFERRFARAPEVAGVAPGRVNLIGEHTDYSDGLVLPCAIDRHTLVLAAPRDDGRVRAWARDLGESSEFDIGRLTRRGGWIDYVQAPFFALAERGIEAHGLDLAMSSRVPMGAGLSSSAALGLAVMGAIDTAQGLSLDALTRARVVHRGESAFVGVECGILDQFASALGREDHALRIDCRNQQVRPIAFAGERLAILLVHSGVERALAAGAYGRRVMQCRRALEQARVAGVAGDELRSLRDLSPADLCALERTLEPVLLRRVRHIVTENARVDAFCAALEAGDHARLGELLAAGQSSLRDDFEVSTPELDALCELAEGVPGVVGSRLTGAGFGGCTLHLVAPAQLAPATEAIADRFEQRYARRPRSYGVRPAAGAFALALGQR